VLRQLADAVAQLAHLVQSPSQLRPLAEERFDFLALGGRELAIEVGT
jgi:hypothetical protein